MNYKELLNPKKFLTNSSTKLSWQLLTILVTLSAIVSYLTISQFGLDFIKDYAKTIAELSPEAIITNSVMIKSIVIIFFMAVLFSAVKVGITSYIFKLILKLFKRDISFFKIINIYLYSKIIYTVFSIPTLLLIDKDKKELVKNFYLNNNIEMVKVLMSDPIYTIFRIIATLLFFGLLFYGIKLSINKITPIKNSSQAN
ncbi:hypothetical protein COS75_00010 [Candidatus Pacearchaeota archaeon CG06_land_8_20_14_3_00_35_12]|nr:MAG: hypothetical protein COS75_00010 [Candidatus Pacearchaeota archaeon CG06_land_8_20_14_3_00_35_12]